MASTHFLNDSRANPVALTPQMKGLQAYLAHGQNENPPPDPRLVRHPWLKGLRRGRMQQTYDWVRNVNTQAAGNPLGDLQSRVNRLAKVQNNKPYAVNFIYNPSDIQISYGIDSSVLPSTQLTAAQLAASAVYPGMTSISFSLLFDRTFECYDPTYRGTPLGETGVYTDIGAFEYMVGINNINVAQGNMLQVPIVVIFGGGSNGKPGLSYVGFITSAGVDYTHFTETMVPMRASLGIQMTQLIGVSPEDAVDPLLHTSALTVADTSYGSLFAANSTASTGTNGTPTNAGATAQ